MFQTSIGWLVEVLFQLTDGATTRFMFADCLSRQATFLPIANMVALLLLAVLTH